MWDQQVFVLETLNNRIFQEVNNASLLILVEWEQLLSEIWEPFHKFFETNLLIVRSNEKKWIECHTTTYSSALTINLSIKKMIEKRRSQLCTITKADNDALAMEKLQRKYAFLVKRIYVLCDRTVSTCNQMQLDDPDYYRNSIRTSYDSLKMLGLQRIELGENVEDVISDEIKVDKAVRSALLTLKRILTPSE